MLYVIVVVVKDYSEEFRDITKARIKESVPTGGITLLTQKPVSDDLPVRLHPLYMNMHTPYNFSITDFCWQLIHTVWCTSLHKIIFLLSFSSKIFGALL